MRRKTKEIFLRFQTVTTNAGDEMLRNRRMLDLRLRFDWVLVFSASN